MLPSTSCRTALSLNQGVRIEKPEDHSEEGLRPILFLPLVKGNASEHRTLTSNPSNQSLSSGFDAHPLSVGHGPASQKDDHQELRRGPIPAH